MFSLNCHFSKIHIISLKIYLCFFSPTKHIPTKQRGKQLQTHQHQWWHWDISLVVLKWGNTVHLGYSGFISHFIISCWILLILEIHFGFHRKTIMEYKYHPSNRLRLLIRYPVAGQQSQRLIKDEIQITRVIWLSVSVCCYFPSCVQYVMFLCCASVQK